MSEIGRIPIRDARLLAGLDNDEVVSGYYDGFQGWPEPGDNRSFSYWHGWKNGAVDGGFREPDDAQRNLVKSYLGTTT